MLLSSSPGEMHSSTTSSDTAKNSAFAQVTQVSTLESTCGSSLWREILATAERMNPKSIKS